MISLNEIRNRAVAFSAEWDREYSEDAEAKSFWDGFFDVFGVPVTIYACNSQIAHSQISMIHTIPPELTKAHDELDRAVDACYGRKFTNKEERIEFLFDLYKKYVLKK